jgi:oxygen-independent coproporphyrinogen-3 oxidase
MKRASRLSQEQRGQERDENEEARIAATLSEMIEMASDYAKQMELEPYYLYRQKNIAGNFENVGYAKVDKAGIYNILIMEEKQSIVAVGAGASTKIVVPDDKVIIDEKTGNPKKIVRSENVKDVEQYISRIDEMIERKGELLWHTRLSKTN